MTVTMDENSIKSPEQTPTTPDVERGKNVLILTTTQINEDAETATPQDSSSPRSSASDSEKSPGGLTGTLLACVLTCALGSSFQFGYNIGNVNAPQSLIRAWLDHSYFVMYGKSLDKEGLDLLWSIAVSIFCIGGMVGGLASGWAADRFGRKKAILMNNVLLLVAAACLTFSKASENFYLLIAGRILVGLNAGLNTGLAPMYITEVSPTNLRGSMGSVVQLSITIAILFAQVLGLNFLFGTAERWPLMFAFAVIPAVLQLIVLPCLPESPKNTLINRDNFEQAEKDLRRIRQRFDVSAELESYREEAAAARKEAKVKISDLFTDPKYQWPLFIAIIMMFSQQLTGINVVMFYSTKIFEGAGLTGDAPVYASIAMAGLNVAMTLISVYLVDHPRFGRRFLHLGGLMGMFVSTILLTVSLAFTSTAPDAEQGIASYASIVFVLLYVVTYACGPGSIPWFFVSEVFASNARGSASSIAVMANWASTLAVAVSFLQLNNWLGPYCFLVFAAVQIIIVLFLWRAMPETKGKSVEQINAEMQKKK